MSYHHVFDLNVPCLKSDVTRVTFCKFFFVRIVFFKPSLSMLGMLKYCYDYSLIMEKSVPSFFIEIHFLVFYRSLTCKNCSEKYLSLEYIIIF